MEEGKFRQDRLATSGDQCSLEAQYQNIPITVRPRTNVALVHSYQGSHQFQFLSMNEVEELRYHMGKSW